MSKEKKVEATLTPRLYRKFLAVKERFGQVANSNVLRILIMEEYDRIPKERATE